MDYKTKQKWLFVMYSCMWVVLLGIVIYAVLHSRLIHASPVTDKQTRTLIRSLATKPITQKELKDIFYTTDMCSYAGTNSKGIELMRINKTGVIVPLGNLPLTQILSACVQHKPKPDVKSTTRWARDDPRWKEFRPTYITGIVPCTQLLKSKDKKVRKSNQAKACRKLLRDEQNRRK